MSFFAAGDYDREMRDAMIHPPRPRQDKLESFTIFFNRLG
jgi:hypothetical protein